jgi:hypothetical protein
MVSSPEPINLIDSWAGQSLPNSQWIIKLINGFTVSDGQFIFAFFPETVVNNTARSIEIGGPVCK